MEKLQDNIKKLLSSENSEDATIGLYLLFAHHGDNWYEVFLGFHKYQVFSLFVPIFRSIYFRQAVNKNEWTDLRYLYKKWKDENSSKNTETVK